MYSAYAVIDGNEICIYDDWSDAEELRLIDPQLDLERNGAGSFTFTLPPTSIAYGTYDLVTYTIDGFDENRHPIMQAHTREVDLIQRIATKIIIYRDMKDGETGMGSAFMRDRQKIWEGRVISEEKDWYNCRAVECEGDLAYLNDTCQKPALFGFAASVTDDPVTIFNHVISYHNSKVDQSKSFTVANDCTITDNRGVTGEQKQYEIDYKSSMETLQDLIKTFGGVVQVYYVKQVIDGSVTWKRMIRWDNKDNIVRTSTLSPQTINFGRNLLDFKCKWDLSKLCTVAVPTGAKVENDGKDEIGDPLPIDPTQGTPTTGQYLLLDDDGIVYVLNSEGSTVAPYKLKDYKTAVYDVEDYIAECDANNQERSVYLTCRLTNGLVAIGFCSMSGYNYDQTLGDTQLGQIVASPQQGYLYQDFIDYKITLPYNCKSVAVCSYGDDIKIGLKRRKFTTTNTVTETAIDRRESGYYDNKPYRLKFKTHQEAIPDTDPVEYREVRDEPPEVEYESNANYRVRTFPFPSDMYDAIDAGTQKIFVFGRAENNTAVFVVTDSADGIDDSNATQLQIHEANDRNGKLEELDKYELTLSPGARSIVVVSYEGGSSSTTIPWPKVTYNRSETKVKNSDTPKEKYVTVETATSCPDWHETGSEYVINKALVEKYGYIERILSFESITNPNLLCQTAVQYLQNIAFDEMTIDISAIDMRALGVTDTDYMNINDELRCVSEYHGLDKFLPITSLSIPLNQPENMKVTIGETTQETMSENSNKINQDLMDSIDTNRVLTLEIAKQNALAIMTEGDTGYVTLKRDGEHIKEIVFSSTPVPENSNNVWIWNQHGLCHADHYPLTASEQVNINAAITQDGSIVADFITAGTLRSILLSGTHAIFGAESASGGGRYEGSMLFCTNVTGSVSGHYKAIQLKNGNIRFMDYDTVSIQPSQNDYTLGNEKEFARIFGKTETQDQSQQIVPMMSISAKILALNLDELWIGTQSGYSHYDQDGNPDGPTDAAVTKMLRTDHGAIKTDSNCGLTGYTLSGGGSAIKVYLPKKTNPDPNDANDWVECYVNNGILTDNTSNPYDEFQIWNGIMVDAGYQ